MTTSSTSSTPSTPNVNTTSTPPKEKEEKKIHADKTIPGGTDYYAPSSKATRSKGVAFGDALSSPPPQAEEGGEKKLERKASKLTNTVDTVQQNENTAINDNTAIEEKTKSLKRRLSGKLTTFFGHKEKAIATTDEPDKPAKETKEPVIRTLKRAISGRMPARNLDRTATTIPPEKTEKTEGEEAELGEKAKARREEARTHPAEKGEKAEKREKPEKAEKPVKKEKSEKAEKPVKKEKPEKGEKKGLKSLFASKKVTTSAGHGSAAVRKLTTEEELKKWEDISGKTSDSIKGMFNFEPNKKLTAPGTDIFRFMHREEGKVGGRTVPIPPDINLGDEDEDFGEYFTNKLLPELMHLAGMVSDKSDEQTVKLAGAEIFDSIEILCTQKRKLVANTTNKPIEEVLLPAASLDDIIQNLMQQLTSSGDEGKIKLGFLLFALNQGPVFELTGQIIELWNQMGGESSPIRYDSLKVKIEKADDGTLSFVSTCNAYIQKEKTDPRFTITPKTTVTLTTTGVKPNLNIRNEVEIHIKEGHEQDTDITNFIQDFRLAGLDYSLFVMKGT